MSLAFEVRSALPSQYSIGRMPIVPFIWLSAADNISDSDSDLVMLVMLETIINTRIQRIQISTQKRMY